MLTLAIFEPPVSACALADQIGSTYHWAPTNGLSTRTPGVTLDTDELERELGATDELERELGATDDGTELDVVAMLELLGTTELVVATDERELGATELVVATDERELEPGTTLLDDPPTIFGQVDRAIQLLLSSQPQPLWVVTHNG